jgi:hypothetical protein
MRVGVEGRERQAWETIQTHIETWPPCGPPHEQARAYRWAQQHAYMQDGEKHSSSRPAGLSTIGQNQNSSLGDSSGTSPNSQVPAIAIRVYDQWDNNKLEICAAPSAVRQEEILLQDLLAFTKNFRFQSTDC